MPVDVGEPNGKAEARVAQLYREHGAALRRALMRLAGPRVDADDLLQEVFMVALRRPGALSAGPSEKAWLYGIAVKVAQAARRRSRLRQFLGLEAVEHVSDERSAAEDAEKSEARRRVQLLLSRLTEKKRTVFVLFELEGMPGEEIAEALGIPLKTVWSRLLHARREFLGHLQREQLRAERIEGELA